MCVQNTLEQRRARSAGADQDDRCLTIHIKFRARLQGRSTPTKSRNLIHEQHPDGNVEFTTALSYPNG